MTPSHHQVRHWMDSQHRISRFSPVATIPNAERVDTVHFIAQALELLASDLRVRKGSGFYHADEPPSSISTPDQLLHTLAILQIQVTAAACTLGLVDALNAAVYEFTNRNSPAGAAAHHEPDFKAVVKKYYNA
jgi:hypothetical protein